MLVVAARNWLFLITVAYKISRRLALLAPVPLPARLPGILLTFVGMVLGLWQSQVYAMLDVALRAIVGKCIYVVLTQCNLLGILAADLLSKCAVVYCLACMSWEAGRQVLRDARMFVMAPQAFLVNNNMLVGGVLPNAEMSHKGKQLEHHPPGMVLDQSTNHPPAHLQTHPHQWPTCPLQLVASLSALVGQLCTRAFPHTNINAIHMKC